MKRYGLNSLVLLLLLLAGCGGSDDNSNATPEEPEVFDIADLLTSAANNLILPALTNFNSAANILNEATQTYLDAPSEANFAALRDQWAKTAVSYEKTYVFHIGVARSRFLNNAIYNWPTVPDAIEGFIANNDITEETVGAISPQIKALAGMEYLLFKSDTNTTHQEFVDDEKRRELLRLSAEFILTQADRLFAIWDTNDEDYTTTFINYEGTGVNASFNLFFNGLYNAVDVAKVSKVGKPGGLETSPTVNPDIAQAPFSGISLELLSASIEMVEQAFFAQDNTTVSDYIFSILEENSLNQDIQTKINEVQEAITAINVPVVEAVNDNPEQVENLHTKLTELGVLLTVDARSALSVIITATDNDGD